MMLPEKIVLATNNQHKVEEIKQILGQGKTKFLTLSEFKDIPEVVEDQDTFEGNALKKAWAIMHATGLSALADDSGLEVDALSLAPGVRSSRYSGGGVSENNRLLLLNLEGVPEQRMTARFRCVVALCIPGKDPVVAQGRVEGHIGFNEKGKGGFGYDPLFIPEGHNVTFAEIGSKEKNALSHRGNALKLLLKKIQTL